MTYKTLPRLGGGYSHLPQLEFSPTPAMSSRLGMRVATLWLHRWGMKYVSERAEAITYHGVVRFLQNPHNEASSHFVFPGSAVPNHITQLVPRNRKSWTEAWYNKSGLSIECADAIWLGRDPDGFAQLARIVAFELHHAGLPPVWARPRRLVARKGFCRHADGGLPAGGHTQCPTTDLDLWRQFVGRVQAEYRRGGFKSHWGRDA